MELECLNLVFGRNPVSRAEPGMYVNREEARKFDTPYIVCHTSEIIRCSTRFMNNILYLDSQGPVKILQSVQRSMVRAAVWSNRYTSHSEHSSTMNCCPPMLPGSLTTTCGVKIDKNAGRGEKAPVLWFVSCSQSLQTLSQQQ